MTATDTPAEPLSDAQNAAAEDFVRIIINRLKADGTVHAPTAIAAAACMAGTYLLRSLDLPIDHLEAGSPVPADANVVRAQVLIDTLDQVLADKGLSPAAAPSDAALLDNKPQLSLTQIQLTLGLPYRSAIRARRLSEHQAAIAGAVAAAKILADSAPVLDPAIGRAIARSGCTVGANTAPLRVPGDARGSTEATDARGKPWYKFW